MNRCTKCHKPSSTKLCTPCLRQVTGDPERLPPFPPLLEMIRRHGSAADMIWSIAFEGHGWRLAK